MKLSNFELKVYRIIVALGFLLLAATYIIRWKLNQPGEVLGLVISTMPNFCAAIILPFLSLLLLYKCKTRFLIKNKDKVFYSTMPLITIAFILSELVRVYHNQRTMDTKDMIVSIAGMALCIIIFEALNKPVTLATYTGLSKSNKNIG